MRKIKTFAAITILAAVATFSAPHAFAGVVMGDHTLQANDNESSIKGVVMGDFTGIILTDLARAITGVVMGD